MIMICSSPLFLTMKYRLSSARLPNRHEQVQSHESKGKSRHFVKQNQLKIPKEFSIDFASQSVYFFRFITRFLTTSYISS